MTNYTEEQIVEIAKSMAAVATVALVKNGFQLNPTYHKDQYEFLLEHIKEYGLSEIAESYDVLHEGINSYFN